MLCKKLLNAAKVNNVAKEKVNLIITHAAELVTLRGGSTRPLLGKKMTQLEIITDGSVAVAEERIVAVGKTSEVLREYSGEETIDATGKLVMPGFVDPHTHLVFACSREEEFEMRIKGASYIEILESGGGILKTVRATRKASVNELVENGKKTLNVMLKHGTTSVEAKSGYGLGVEDEVKCLEVVKQLKNEHVVDLVPTFLGAHAVPEEYKGNVEGYVRLIVEEMIPSVATRKLAEFCDVFCEKGVFTVEQTRRILHCGREHGLALKLHADELSQLGGAELAAEVGAVSASHLLFASENGVKAMAKKGVIAVLLPAASLALMTNRYADARKMIGENVAIALGTDFNPSCWIENQQLVIALACLEMKLTPAEAIVATTINAAHAIKRAHEVGSLEVGKKADIIVLDVPNHKFLGYRFGVNLVEKVIKAGRLVVDNGRVLC